MIYVNSETNKQIKDNEILFIGCSHTAGAGHGEINDMEEWTASRDTVYTHIFCKALGLNPKIDSHVGKGNYFTEEKINTYNLRNKKVIIQFTDVFRLRLNGKDINKFSNDFTIEISEVYTNELLTSLFYEQVKRIVNLLTVNNCQFLFFQLIPPRWQYILEVYEHLLQYKEFVYVSEEIRVDKGTDDVHYGPKTHDNVANLLLIKWRKLYNE
tara:strand:+ start:269 stop:904 length:636 start_codon:yes stop_codon:yes gene_type:complete